MGEYFPLNFSQITCINSVNLPSTIKQRNNRAYAFWSRALYERALSVFKFILPEDWIGPQKELMKFVLARNGFGAVSYDSKFGHFFQPVSLTGYGFFYQPTTAILSNPLLKKEMTIGKDCELVMMTPDYIGIWDIIDYYAVKLSQLDTSINTALVNSKNAYLLFASQKSAAHALKKAMDLINQGEPAVVFDSRALLKQNVENRDQEPIIKIDLDAKSNAEIVGIALADLQTILNNFDNEVGIQTVGGNLEKKERLTQFEGESKKNEAKARCSIWLESLQDSFKRVNKLYPELKLDVELNFEEEDCEGENMKEGDTNADDE